MYINFTKYGLSKGLFYGATLTLAHKNILYIAFTFEKGKFGSFFFSTRTQDEYLSTKNNILATC